MIDIIQKLPTKAGVYQYFDKYDRLLYIGKAKNLKNRVKSYWRFGSKFSPNPTLGIRIIKMLEQVVRVEYIVVESEIDALVLENSLIKQLNPKYNILLRDDKTYPYIYIDESHDFPRFELTRKVIKGKKISYYGPFPTGGRVLLDALYEVFPLVQKKSCLQRAKACLFYQIERCLAPCEGKVSAKKYQEIVNQAKKAIVKRSILVDTLSKKMMRLAMAERYEEATLIRDNIKTIESLRISSNIDLARLEDMDIFAIVNGENRGVVVKLFMRGGKIISSDFSTFRSEIYDKNEVYRQALLEFYSLGLPQISKTILVAHPFDDMEIVAQLLSKQFSKKIYIVHPKIGTKAKLTQLALTNGSEILKLNSREKDEIEPKIAELFELDSTPHKVESFDNSHMMGVAPVGVMVVWSENSWKKSLYRRYSLKERDEYGQMREMLLRRIANFDKTPPPNLWILDGGDTILQLALRLLDEVGVNLSVIAIAKEKLDGKAYRAKGASKDIIYTKDSVFELKTTDKRLQWVQRQRDEAHRFAILYHQNRKRKEDIKNSLLEKKGIGPATLKKLLNYFGTFEAINRATFEELSVASSQKVAKILKNR